LQHGRCARRAVWRSGEAGARAAVMRWAAAVVEQEKNGPAGQRKAG